MDKLQEQMLKTVLEKVHQDKAGETQELLGGLFDMMNKGELNASHIAESAPKLMKMIKPEHIAEAKGLLEGLTKNLGK